MDAAGPMDDGAWLSTGRLLRLLVAVLSGPAIVQPLVMSAHLLPFPDGSGPLWLGASSLILEALYAYWPMLMVLTSLSIHRLLSPRPARNAAAFYLPVLLWGLHSTVFIYFTFYGHWQPRVVLHQSWLVGLVVFPVLGLVLLLSVPGLLVRELGRRMAQIGLRAPAARPSARGQSAGSVGMGRGVTPEVQLLGAMAKAGVVIMTVFLDWALISTQAIEHVVVPVLDAAR